MEKNKLKRTQKNRLVSSSILLSVLCLLALGGENAKQAYAASSAQTGENPATDQMNISEQSFLDAALEGDFKVVQAALEQGMDVNAVDEDNRTALMFASYNGHTDIVRLLLDSGARINGQDGFGRTALIFAASGPNQQTVELLLSNNADIDIADGEENWTALMFAAAEGQAEVVETLLQHGADTTLKDVDGDTALDFSRNYNHPAVAKLLE